MVTSGPVLVAGVSVTVGWVEPSSSLVSRFCCFQTHTHVRLYLSHRFFCPQTRKASRYNYHFLRAQSMLTAVLRAFYNLTATTDCTGVSTRVHVGGARHDQQSLSIIWVSHSDAPHTSTVCLPLSGEKYHTSGRRRAATCGVKNAKWEHRLKEFQNWKGAQI